MVDFDNRISPGSAVLLQWHCYRLPGETPGVCPSTLRACYVVTEVPTRRRYSAARSGSKNQCW